MVLSINTNLASLNAQRNLASITVELGKSARRLSSGLRIVTAADDAAGLAISERFRARIAGLQQAQRNANDGISLVQTAEGSLNEISNLLIRMRELAVQANTGTISDADRDTLDAEFSALISEVDRIAQATDFNGISLLNGASSSVSFQVGAGTGPQNVVEMVLSSSRSSDLGISGLDLSSATPDGPSTAIVALDTAIDAVVQNRGRLGAVQNRLQSSINFLDVQVSNLSAAESRIRDVDIAEETARFARLQILQQAAIAVLAQANVQPQIALQLLG